MPPSSRPSTAAAVVVGALCAVVVAVAGASAARPSHIDLPGGYQPEGVAAGKGRQLFVGSIPTGAVRTVDTKTGRTSGLVPAHDGRAAIGLKSDGKRLYVAGGPTGSAFVYDAKTGRDVEQLKLAPDGQDTFVNDVTIAKKAAYFTDSRRQALYVVDQGLNAKELALPDIPLSPGNNLNGIAATSNGKLLLAVQSNTGALWRIDPKTGAATAVDLRGRKLTNGDGLLLEGRTLYAVLNRDNRIAVVALDKSYASGRITKTITSNDFDVPTTIARQGKDLFAVDARFGTTATPTTPYWITRVSS
jgi:sugar lactone lactonase YvrE